MALTLHWLDELEMAENISEDIYKERQKHYLLMEQVAYLPILSLPDDEPIVWASWDEMSLWSCHNKNNTVT